jgi:esterase/lipase superfamily enzyme
LASGVHLHKLFLATSREQSPDLAIYFSGERSTTMAFAQVTASIPPDHKLGKIELPSGKVPNP